MKTPVYALCRYLMRSVCYGSGGLYRRKSGKAIFFGGLFAYILVAGFEALHTLSWQ